jgi:hypothetical protein
MGAIIYKLWTPMTFTDEHRLKPTEIEGDAPLHGRGGHQSRPLPRRAWLGLASGGGGARSGLIPGQPPASRPRALHVPAGGAPACRGLMDQATGNRPTADSLPDCRGDLLSLWRGSGPWFDGCPPPSQASPVPPLGRATKFWDWYSFHIPKCPKI